MHELSIALSIVDGALEELQRHRAREATAIHLRLGRLSGVDEKALLFSYGLAAQETVLERTQLVIEPVDVVIFCSQCGTERPTRSFPALICDRCGSLAERVVHGNELEITGMEIVS